VFCGYHSREAGSGPSFAAWAGPATADFLAHRKSLKEPSMAFDWHSEPLRRDTPVTPDYRNTQNVRRFMTGQCGAAFKFDRDFMAWIRNDTPKTMGDVVDEWHRRHSEAIRKTTA
jgi:hypothetical protein